MRKRHCKPKKRRGKKLILIIFIVLIIFAANKFISDGAEGLLVANPTLIFNPGLLFSEDEPENNTDLKKLKEDYYIVDGKTGMSPDLFNIEEFEKADLTIKPKKNKPKILIFHTHSHEAFADSRDGVTEDTIVGVGDRLSQILEEKYGIGVLHVTDTFDYVDGELTIMGAYERMEPVIRQYLKKNKSIEMVIDLHRDGVADGTRLVTEINGKPAAQVMFFNGLCKIYKDGALQDIDGLENPYVKTNLALSYRMKKNADLLYPEFARKIYLNAYRYSLHMKPLSTLIELGAQTNTVEEEYNGCEALADIIAHTVLDE